MSAEKHEIRAKFDEQTITVYQAYNQAIAIPAIENNRFVAPFSFDRMTWVKPSFLWMMYRSDWAQNANQEHILAIQIKRKNWENALKEAILTTPSQKIYKNAEEWKELAKKARVRVQWDPERGLRNQRLTYRSIQVGISKHLIQEYSQEWIVKITDINPLVKQIHQLVLDRAFEKAEELLPEEQIYPISEEIRQVLGM